MENNRLDLSKFKNCNCGNTIESSDVKIKNDYSLLGWFWWSMGATAIPKSISFECLNCKSQFEVIKENKLIRYYIFFRRY